MKYSIIVPVYNREKYIKRCLDSVINQTYQNYEVIVINDGSTDRSEEIIMDFVNKDSKIKYFKKENTGIADTRNFAIKKVTGDYILFLDSDDYFDVKLLETLNNYTNNNYDLIKYRCRLVDDNKTIKEYKSNSFNGLNKTESLKNIVNDEIIDVFWLYAFNANFYKKNNFQCEKGCVHEDFGLIPYILLASSSILSIDYIGYNYYQNDVSITTSKQNKRFNDFMKQYFILVDSVNKISKSQEEKDIILIYITDSVIRKYEIKELSTEVKKVIKQYKIYNNLPVNTLKRLIKKIALQLNIKYYLFLTDLGRK